MSVILTGFKIWIVTIFLNATAAGIILLFKEGAVAVALSIALTIGSFIIGLPFLAFTIGLIKLTTFFPYSVAGKMTWVFLIESLLVAGFYACIKLALNNGLGFNTSETSLLTGTTIAAFLVALYINRGAFARASAGTSSAAAASTDTNSRTP